MWNDEKNAAEHYEDLKKVKARIESEPLQIELPGQISTSKDMRDYRLKTIDALIKASESEMAMAVPAKQGEVYR
jgi:hypothetical protein